jgi:hypothetical protein
MATRASSIKLRDLSTAIDRAAKLSGKKIPNDWIMGRMIRESLAKQIDANAVARSITKDMAASMPGFRLTPKVIIAGGICTMGFIAREVDLNLPG